MICSGYAGAAIGQGLHDPELASMTGNPKRRVAGIVTLVDVGFMVEQC